VPQVVEHEMGVPGGAVVFTEITSRHAADGRFKWPILGSFQAGTKLTNCPGRMFGPPRSPDSSYPAAAIKPGDWIRTFRGQMFQTNARESVAAKIAVGGVRGGKVGPGQLFADEAIDIKRLAGEGTAKPLYVGSTPTRASNTLRGSLRKGGSGHCDC